MQKYGLLTKQAAPPERLLADVSRAVDASPRIEVDRIQWSSRPRIRRTARAMRPVPRGAHPRRRPCPARPGPPQSVYEVAELSGKVLAVKASDYRASPRRSTSSWTTCASGPGVEVVGTKMPVETSSASRLSGDIGTDALDAKVPQFT